MTSPVPPGTPTNRLFVLEAAMILLLVALAIYLYLRPAADRFQGDVMWWHWMSMAVLFFGAIALHMERKRRAGRDALHQVIREDAERGQAG